MNDVINPQLLALTRLNDAVMMGHVFILNRITATDRDLQHDPSRVYAARCVETATERQTPDHAGARWGGSCHRAIIA